jgi:Leucine-rich repeat (LRR) protein
LFHIGNCTNEKIDPVPITTQSLLTSFINNITLSNRTIAKNGPTPEDRALSYLIVNDTTFNFTQLLDLKSMMTNMVQFRICQRYALLTLWFQQTFTNTLWTRRNGWLMNANECDNWYGIYCASINGTVGMQNVVTSVDLGRNNMRGTIPADLGLLTALTYTDVQYNALTGILPASIGQCTALTTFSVNNNALTGTIPASIGNWSQIQYAFFDGNQFTGTMPNGICDNVDAKIGDQLIADCKSEIVCLLQDCCTECL